MRFGPSRSQGRSRAQLTISASSLGGSKLTCDHIVRPCTIDSNSILLNTVPMDDSGTTDLAYIDVDFAQLHGLKFIPMQHPRALSVADGRTVSSGSVTHLLELLSP